MIVTKEFYNITKFANCEVKLLILNLPETYENN